MLTLAETRAAAARAARIAAYGSEFARTPADYTLLEALAAMKYDKTRRLRKGEAETVEDVGVLGPIFEGDE